MSIIDGEDDADDTSEIDCDGGIFPVDLSGEDDGPDRNEDEDEDDEDERDFIQAGEEDDRSMFADPGGTSALRAATKDNPRNRPCPTCKQPDRLTPKDVALGYQCDMCADRLERGMDVFDY